VKKMEYVLDSIGNQAGVRTFGAMTIADLVYPTSVEPNSPFDISYDATNTSGTTQNAFGYIFDFTTQQPLPGSLWQHSIAAGGTYPLTIQISGITSTFSGEVRVGHVEGEGDCLSPIGDEGLYICGNPSYQNAPLVGHRYLCSAGSWVDQGTDQGNCPTGGGGFNPMYVMAAIGAIVVVGIVFMVGQRGQTKRR